MILFLIFSLFFYVTKDFQYIGKGGCRWCTVTKCSNTLFFLFFFKCLSLSCFLFCNGKASSKSNRSSGTQIFCGVNILETKPLTGVVQFEWVDYLPVLWGPRSHRLLRKYSSDIFKQWMDFTSGRRWMSKMVQLPPLFYSHCMERVLETRLWLSIFVLLKQVFP